MIIRDWLIDFFIVAVVGILQIVQICFVLRAEDDPSDIVCLIVILSFCLYLVSLRMFSRKNFYIVIKIYVLMLALSLLGVLMYGVRYLTVIQ